MPFTTLFRSKNYLFVKHDCKTRRPLEEFSIFVLRLHGLGPRIRSIGFDLPPTEIKRAEMASPRFSFSISATDGKARTGAITMQRGNIRTPAFMPVGTAATVKAMRPEEEIGRATCRERVCPSV